MPELVKTLQRLEHPLVRALCWSCFTPDLLATGSSGHSSTEFPLDARRADWLERLNREPAELERWMQQRCLSRRLGIVHERLWHFLLHSDPESELLATNLPVRDHQRTLGELDVLYFCHRRNKPVHLELAVKFYLALPSPLSSHPLSRWLGPEGRDRLDVKIRRLIDHQLPLSKTENAAIALRPYCDTAPETALRFSGVLFQHSKDVDFDDPMLNPVRQRGRWMHTADFRPSASGEWRYWPKPDWLLGAADIGSNAAPPLVPNRALRFMSTRPEESLGDIMVVHDGWPSQKKSL